MTVIALTICDPLLVGKRCLGHLEERGDHGDVGKDLNRVEGELSSVFSQL